VSDVCNRVLVSFDYVKRTYLSGSEKRKRLAIQKENISKLPKQGRSQKRFEVQIFVNC